MNKSVSKSTKKEEVIVKPVALVEEKPVTKKAAAKPAAKVDEVVTEPKKAAAKPAAEPVAKKSSTKSATKVEEAAAEPVAKKSSAKAATKVEEVAAEPAKKSSKKAAKVEEAVAEPVAEASSSEEKRRREVTRETVEADFDGCIKILEDRIGDASAEDKKSGNTKLFRTLVKQIKSIKGDVARISKQRVRGTRQNNTSSGFMKPVKISSDIASFTGWDASQMRSRVEVTKFLCDYVKTHNLQNPEDRRQIIPDNKLSKLLDYDKKREDKPLTYAYLQHKIQPHFVQSA
jgi:chromatin remodeling complex protein RSC6